MNKHCLIGVGVVGALFLIMFIVVPFISNYGSNGLSVQFYDENGDPIGTPLAFVDPAGNIVAGFKATVWWRIVGTNVDPATISITGTLKVSMLSVNDRWLTLNTESISGATAESDHSKSYNLDSLLSDYMGDDYKNGGWPMKVESSVTAQMSDTSGNALEPRTVTDIATFSLTWYEGSFTLESGVTLMYP